MAGAFLQQELAQRWVCYMAPKLMGSSARPVLDFPLHHMHESRALELTDLRAIGQDIRMTFDWRP